MTDRFKTALEVFNRLIPSLEHSLETRLRDFHNNEPIDEMLASVREALTLAQQSEAMRLEAEQLRKDKEATKRTLDGAQVLLSVTARDMGNLRKERDELTGKVAELETFIARLEAAIQSRGIELP